MTPVTAEQLTADSRTLLREWDALDKDDERAVLEHLAKLKAIATFLNAEVSTPHVPSA
jgi:hypothetical protein